MAKLLVDQSKVTPETAEILTSICPFSAITYDNGRLEINAACKMCSLCVKKGPSGVITLSSDDEAPVLDKSKWVGIVVFVEHRDGVIHNVTKELIGKARELASVTHHPVYALMMGHDIGMSAKKLLKYGVDKVFVYDCPALENYMIEPYANVFSDFIEKIKPSSILVGATNVGRSLAPRVAARFSTGLTADCTVLEMKENTDLIQIRPAFGGNIMAQIVTPKSRPQFCTVRYKIFSVPPKTDSPTGAVLNMSIAPEKLMTSVKLIGLTPKPREEDISEAQVIVAVGRGFKSQKDLAIAQELADILGAQLAGTRPMIEAGWLDPKRQIGLSGRTVNAKLIITLGVSGSVQFAAGMRSSQCIIAVNSNRDAPIFDLAHYGVVGDLYEILPRLITRCKELKTNEI